MQEPVSGRVGEPEPNVKPPEREGQLGHVEPEPEPIAVAVPAERRGVDLVCGDEKT